MIPSNLLATARLQLRVLGSVHTQALDTLASPHELEYAVLNHFTAHCHEYLLWTPALEECYVLPARRAAPYEKRLTLTFDSLNYPKMESLLKLKVPSAVPQPTPERRLTVWHESLAPQLFSAALVITGHDVASIVLLTGARYTRVMAGTSPLLWSGEVSLDFTFPDRFFDPVLRPGIPKLVGPR